MIILNHLPKLQHHFFVPLKPKTPTPHFNPSLIRFRHFPIFSLFSSLSPILPSLNPKSPNFVSKETLDDDDDEPNIELSIEKLFVPPETDISSLTSSSNSKNSTLSARILKGSNIVLSKYASNAQVINAEFVKSSVNTEASPADGLPEFALVGRSNVGKSSLLNSLVRRKKLALTSKKPG